MSYKSVLGMVLVLLAVSAAAEDRWVTDEFEVMLRTGKSTQQSIVRQLRSGTKVELLEVDESAGYSRIRLGQDIEGWVLSRYLTRTPTARLRLPELEDQLAASRQQRVKLEQELQSLRQNGSELQRELAELQDRNAVLQSDLDRISRLSADTIRVDNENSQLKTQLADSERVIADLTAENARLAGRANREWFVIGAAVLLTGLLLGLIIPRIRWRRKSSWGEL